MSKKHPFPVPVVNKKDVGSVVEPERHIAVQFWFLLWKSFGLVPAALFPESQPLFFYFFYFVLHLCWIRVQIRFREHTVPIPATVHNTGCRHAYNNDQNNISGENDQNNALANKCFLEAMDHLVSL
jgi:hypothetical protein